MRGRPGLKALLGAALLAAWAGVVHLAHLAAVAQDSVPDADRALFIPDGKSLRHFVLGQQTTVADLYWLKFIQYLGGTTGAQPQMLPLARLITDLDPEYAYAYMAPGLVLASKRRFGESNEILEKGWNSVQSRWEIPFYLAFNYWYELGDWEKGAEWLKRAVSVPGRPPYLAVLVPRLLATAGDMDSAIAFVRTMAEQAPNEQSRKEFEHKLGQFVLERDLQRLEAAIETYRVREGRLPWALGELGEVLLGSLSLPADAYGYEPTTGKVSCSRLEKRLKVNIPKNLTAQPFDARSAP